jgi:hypothetical protein
MFPNFDPSKVDPQVMMKMSELVSSLPPAQLQKMQTLMHNTMAGFDARKEMEEFERSLPPHFRAQLMQIMMGPGGHTLAQAATGMGADSGTAGFTGFTPSHVSPEKEVPATVQSLDAGEEVRASSEKMSLRDARMTVLSAVRDQKMSLDAAYGVLFPSEG